MKIAIVGAGMAGLAAAEILVQDNQVTLYEASDRVGGRAWTEDIGGEPIDWGCEALEAGDLAPTAKLEEYGTKADAPEDCDPYIRAINDHGAGIVNDVFGAGAADQMDENVSVAQQHYGLFETMREQSGPGAAAQFYDEFVAASDDITAEVDLDPGAARIDALLSEYGSFSESSALGESSAFDRGRAEFLQAKKHHESGATYFEEGLGAVVYAWADDKILRKAKMTLCLSTPIESIRNVDDGVEVTPKNRSPVAFDAVIVTVPTRVIADEEIEIEDLSPEQLQAFRDCPLGHYHKIAVTGMGNLTCPAPNKRVYMCDEELNYAFYISASPQGHYYMAHIAGAQAEICNADHGGTEKAFLAMLLALNPDAKKPDNPVFYHSNWHEDPCVGGAYSYSKAGKGLARQILHQLTVGRIYFAGEACSLMWYGSLAGAMETGQETAMRLVQDLESLPPPPCWCGCKTWAPASRSAGRAEGWGPCDVCEHVH